MAKKNAIVKKLPAVEALGCANYICSDKTGTLTQNKMTVTSAYCPVMDDCVHLHTISNAMVRGGSRSPVLSSSPVNGDTVLLYHGEPLEVSKIPSLQVTGCLCNNSHIAVGPAPNGTITSTGQPTEAALLAAAHRLGVADKRPILKRLKEVGFSSETKFMEVSYQADPFMSIFSATTSSKVHNSTNISAYNNSSGNADEVRYLKGALEVILPMCVNCVGHNAGEIVPLTAAAVERVQQHSLDMSDCGGLRYPIEPADSLRALSVAKLAGIYSGPIGTDVAKEAAAMVIVDDDFSTIVNAIEEGKSIFYNIKNFLTFQLSTSIAALSLVAINNLVGRPNPLNPMQILWINIIMDGPLAQSLGVESVDPSVMQRPPRKRQDNIITRPLLMRVITSGILILLGTMYIFIHEMEDEGATVSSRDLTMTFTTFVIHNSRPVFELSWNSNKAFLLAAAFSLGGQFLVFRTVALSAEDIFFVVCLSSTMMVLDTIRKKYFPRIFTETLATDRDNKLARKKGAAKDGSAGEPMFMV
eukprot:gene31741-41200_t